MNTLILKLDVAGQPIDWITPEDGARLYCRDQVAWEAGESTVRLHGGYSRIDGSRSVLDVNTIVAARSIDKGDAFKAHQPALTNRQLFRRDDHMCMYCGSQLPDRYLTRDHVTPISRGGKDEWENVVAACRPCNQRKDNKLLDELGVCLLAIPYIPNRAEGLILANRRILADQTSFLTARVGRGSRLSET